MFCLKGYRLASGGHRCFTTLILVSYQIARDHHGISMADSRKIVKIFLASPGDLQEERRAAKTVVDEFNNIWADYLGYHVELVGWEDTISVYGRPQATINRDLERCEFFIGMIWKRWGTPPDVSGPYTSGFEEEFRTSESNRQKKGSPEISLFSKTVSADLLRDPGDQLKKVIEFKDQIIAEKGILFETFDSIGDFREKILRCITRYVQKLKLKEIRERAEESQARSSTDSVRQSTSETTSKSESPFSVEGAEFLQNLISRTEGVAEQEWIAPVEVARFRLLASTIWKQGNDEQFLGVHDANILFVHRSDLALSRSEQMGLIDSGLAHYSSETTPLWYWLARFDAFNRGWLQICSLVGTTAEHVGALSAMRLILEPLSSEIPWDKDKCMKSWFSDTAPSERKVAALGYLADCGTADDLPAVRAEVDRGDYQTSRAAIDAVVRINLRDSREKAMVALFELQPASVNSSLLAALFENSASISTEVLLKGLGNQSPDVRRIVVKLLRKRGALDVEVADQLTSDNDAAVRFEALQSLVDGGRQFSNEEAKKILVKPVTTLGGLFNPFAATDNAGETYWKQFGEERMAEMTDRDLEQKVSDSLDFHRSAEFVLDERRFSTRGDKLRAAVDDQFKTEFAEKLEKIAQKFGSESDLIERLRSLEDYLRNEFTRKGLDVICRKGGPQDLSRIRSILKNGVVGYSDVGIEYLQKFGEWEDISLIIATLDQSESRRTGLLLAAPDDGKYRSAARAIYSLGRERLDELLSLSAPNRLLSHLIVESSDKAFRALSNNSITQLFRSEHDAVRKAAALKCIRALPKRRLAELLNSYVSGDADRYYNVIHWLDLGVSIPRDRARSAAETVLAREWRT